MTATRNTSTRIPARLLGLTALAILGLAVPPAAHAQLTTLFSFSVANGYYPAAGLTLSGTTLYGTTGGGGASGYGTVFSMPTGGGAVTTLAAFNNTNGANPYSVLTLSGTTLYGTTAGGGNLTPANRFGGYGTVFSVPTGGGAVTTLAAFNNTNGAGPQSGVTLSGATLYGTTFVGGASGGGTVFSVPTGGGAVTTLATFTSPGDEGPVAGLTLSGTTLYGTTTGGTSNFGSVDGGTVFSIPVGGGPRTTLAAFNISNGSDPAGVVTLSADGKTLYGTTSGGGGRGYGTVFSVPAGGGAVTTLATFVGTNGYGPIAGVTLSADGKTLYGTTQNGGANGDGTVFSVPTGGGPLTTLVDFNGTNGQSPRGYLILSGGTLYGTTGFGGANNAGTVFALAVAPEPSGWASLGLGTLGLAGLALRAHRRKPRSA